jgi:hypothetical protein
MEAPSIISFSCHATFSCEAEIGSTEKEMKCQTQALQTARQQLETNQVLVAETIRLRGNKEPVACIAGHTKCCGKRFGRNNS